LCDMKSPIELFSRRKTD